MSVEMLVVRLHSSMDLSHPLGGLFDAEDSYGPFAVYGAIEAQNPGADNRLLMGPWYHGQWAWDDGASLGNVHFGSNTAERYKEMELEFFTPRSNEPKALAPTMCMRTSLDALPPSTERS